MKNIYTVVTTELVVIIMSLCLIVLFNNTTVFSLASIVIGAINLYLMLTDKI